MRADDTSWPYHDPGSDAPDWAAGGNGQDWTAGDDSWPGGNGQDWTAGDDSWSAGGNPPGWPYGEDHPSWPAGSDHPGWPRAGGGSASQGREPAAALHHDPRSPTAPPPAPVARRVRVPAGGGPEGTQQWSAQPGPAAGTAPPPYYEVAFGEGRVQLLAPSANQDWPAGA